MSATLTFAERMQNAGIGTVIGVGTVFLILIFLWGLLTLMHKVFYRPEKPAAEVKEATPVQEAAVAAEADDTQLIAVLTAAVAAVLDAQNIQTGFKIKSFRRTKS